MTFKLNHSIYMYLGAQPTPFKRHFKATARWHGCQRSPQECASTQIWFISTRLSNVQRTPLTCQGNYAVVGQDQEILCDPLSVGSYWKDTFVRECQPLISFITEYQYYVYLRAPRLTSSGDIFCAWIEEALAGIPVVQKLDDDVLVTLTNISPYICIYSRGKKDTPAYNISPM